MKARNLLHGRKFGGKEVEATYLEEEKWMMRDYS